MDVRYPNRFVQGHHSRIKLSKSVFKKGSVSWNKGKKGVYTKETLLKISTSSGKYWSEKKNKERHSNLMIQIMNDPRIKEETSKTWFKKGVVSDKKDKKYEEMYGLEKALIIKQKIKDKRLFQIWPFKDTKLELIFQEAIRKYVITDFDTHIALPGQPDIFISPNICIFVDGCWWHACSTCFDYLDDKNIAGDYTRKQAKEKDQNVTKTLQKQNYLVLRFWEHEINNDIESCLSVVRKVLYDGK